MISNYNLDCDYHNFELKDKIYLIPESALKIIYTDGYNEAVFTGDDSNVTILEGYDISFQEESSFDERFKFSRTLSIKVDGYKTFNDFNYRYMVIIETKDGEFYIVNSDFQSFVTHTYTLTNGTNSTELVFSSQSNIPTIKLTGFEPNVVNFCKEYNIPKIRKFKLTDASLISTFLSTWKKSLINNVNLSNIEPLPDSISLQEEFDGEKYTVTLGFDIPMNYFKNDWHIKLLEFEKNKYRGYVQLEDGNIAFIGYNTGLFPSYTINGDIISIRLTETSIRGISYGNDYAVIDTDMPKSIVLEGETCQNYNFESSCNWEVESKPNYITITPMSGNADTQYTLQVCNTDAETGYAVSEFVIRSCSARFSPEVIIKNPLYRWINTQETICVPTTNERWIESGTTCAGTYGVDKHVNNIKLVSYDNGETWYNSGVESATTLIEVNSSDCGYAERWINSGTTCVGHDKYTNSYKQISNDSGHTWITPQPIQYSATTLIEVNSSDCGTPSYVYEYFTIIPDMNATVAWTPSSSSHGNNNDLYYYVKGRSRDWVKGNAVAVYGGDEVMFKGELEKIGEGGHFTVSSDGYKRRFKARGNIMSLLFKDNFAYKTDLTQYGHVFYKTFADTRIYDVSSLALPATTLANDCYAYMFSGCTSLTAAPELPATTLANNCYHGMFRGCTNLTTATELPATTLKPYCYWEMFSGCTSLTTAPQLSATTLAENCYRQMFQGCTSLTAATELPVTTLANSCYMYMFNGCKSLTTAPELPATTLANSCYLNMFAGCTSLTTAPDLPATTLAVRCYKEMFQGCTSLIISPKLSATTLANECCEYMFGNCTSLTTAPQLYATTLVNGCYRQMFDGCSSLTAITCLATDISASNCTLFWIRGVAESGTFTKAASMNDWPTMYYDGIPNGWSVVNYNT